MDKISSAVKLPKDEGIRKRKRREGEKKKKKRLFVEIIHSSTLVLRITMSEILKSRSVNNTDPKTNRQEDCPAKPH